MFPLKSWLEPFLLGIPYFMVYDQKKIPIGIPLGRMDFIIPPGLGLTKTQGKKATKLDQSPGGNPGGLGLLGY